MNLLVHFVIYGHSWCFESSQIALAYGSCNFESFQNITRAHKSRNALAFIRFPIRSGKENLEYYLHFVLLLTKSKLLLSKMLFWITQAKDCMCWFSGETTLMGVRSRGGGGGKGGRGGKLISRWIDYNAASCTIAIFLYQTRLQGVMVPPAWCWGLEGKQKKWINMVIQFLVCVCPLGVTAKLNFNVSKRSTDHKHL